MISISDCYSVELSILHDDTRQLNKRYFGDDDTDEIDLSQFLSSDDLNPSIVSRDLNSRTDMPNPLVPRDLNVAIDILSTIIRYIYHWLNL